MVVCTQAEHTKHSLMLGRGVVRPTEWCKAREIQLHGYIEPQRMRVTAEGNTAVVTRSR